MTFKKTMIIEIRNYPRIYYDYEICFKDGGIYMQKIIDMNPSYGERKIEKLFFPLDMIEKITFPEKSAFL